MSLFTGAFTYSYPIEVPPGRHGIQPSLTLLYNSQAQNGWLGLGWNLSLGSIQRSTRNGIPSYTDSQDTFLLQFQGASDQLVSISTGLDGRGSYTEYRAQIEASFLRTRFYAPSLWVVTSKDGTQYEFTGVAQNTSNSKYYYWSLSRVFDPLGNYMQVNYPSLSSATATGTPGPGGSPTAIYSTGAVVGFMPSSITYTGTCTAVTCASISSAPYATVTFAYEIRPDSMTSAMEGGEQVITTRLKSVQTNANGSAVRTYQLGYSTSPLGNSLLTTIALVGSDSVTTLSTSTFGYQTNATYVVTLSTAYQLPVDITQAAFADVNGDGLPDIVQNYTGIGSGAWLNTGNGWQYASQWIPPTALANGSGDTGVRFADVNGDGYTDILQAQEGRSLGAWINTGSSWTVAASSWNPPVNFTSLGYFTEGSLPLDVNGDGLPDLAQNVLFDGVISSANWLNTGSGWGPGISTWIPPSPLYEVVTFHQWQLDKGLRFADFDGDGLVDVIQGLIPCSGCANQSEGWLNNGNGFYRNDVWGAPTAFTDQNSKDLGARVADINGDSLPDVVQYSSNPVVFHIWLNTGRGWQQNDSYAPSVSSISTNGTLQFVDLNGDGVPDIIAVSTNPASDRVYLGASAPSNVLTSINNGMGGTTTISYAFSPPPAQPGMHLPPTIVVQSMTTTDGMPGTSAVVSSYAFSGGLFAIARPNREFLGFRTVTATDAQGNATVTHFLQNDGAVNGINIYKGMTSEQDSYDSAGNLLAYSTYTVSYSTPFVGVYFPIVAEVDSHLGPKQSAVAYAYDSYGNQTQEKDYGDVTVTGDERTIVTTYSGSTGTYLVGYPVSKRVFAGLGTTGALLSDTSYFYDASYTVNPSSGLLTKTDQWHSGGQDPVSTTTYDAYGNVTDTYDPLYNATSGAQGNHAHTTYETAFNQYPKAIQQGVGSALNLPAETFSYDPGTGQMLSHVDVNGSTTTYSYDLFGRLASVVGPADQVTPSSPTLTYQYNLNAAPPSSIYANSRVVHGSSLTLVTYTFFDGLGRQLESKTASPNKTQIVGGAVVFNNLGLPTTSYVSMSRAASSSYVIPASTQPASITAYDGLRRVVQVTYPDATISTRAYSGWTETDTDANGHSKTYVKDAYGRIVEVDERNSTTTYVTTYQYDLLGNLTNIINALGQGTTVYFDTLGRKTTMADPQMGTWQYQYDPNGNLLQQTDAKNQVITMTYDAISRRTFKIYPDATTISYTYDSGAYAVGKLSQVVDLSGSTSFAYDSEGNVLSKTRNIAGKVYVTSMTYDALGREASLIYPDGTTVKDLYDGSMLTFVQSADGALSYAGLSYSTSAPAKVGSVLYGNGMQAQYGYDSKMLRLLSLKTLTSGGTAQFLSYGYDNVGNITQITDSTGPMTQTFTYDPLDRLSQAAGPYGTHQYSYDATGGFLVNMDNARGFWGFDDTSGVTQIQGSVVSTPARVGNGLLFYGTSQATINGSQYISPPSYLTVSMWLRPKALGSDYAVFKSTSFYFPQIESDGSLDAKLELSSGEQVVHVSSGALLNLWSYLVLTYDGGAINIYVDGQLWKSQAASGTILTSTQPIVLGSGLNGLIDELDIEPQALSATQILQRYNLYPPLAQNQPFAPASVPAGMTAGVINSTYTFAFTAWDLNGNALKYRIDWGNGGGAQDTAYSPSGTTVQSTVCFTSTGTYPIRFRSVEPAASGGELLSSWSPTYNIFITSPALTSALAQPFLVGASAAVETLAGISRLAAPEVGEPLTGISNTSQNIGAFGYQGSSIAVSNSTSQPLGAQGTGGTDAIPTSVMSVSNLLAVNYSTAAVDISTIALNVLEHGATVLMDANGNMRVENGRWILFDFDNKPSRVITPDATLALMTYDFEGNRTQQAIAPPNQAATTTTYVGGIYQNNGAGGTKYITAGSLRAALLDSTGTTAYFVPDQIQSTALLVSNAQAAVRSTQYQPYGGTFRTSGSVDDAHKFTGQRLDDSSGIYYLSARFLDPFQALFISPDPILQNIFDPQLLNRFVYCRNSPEIYVDPTGNSISFGWVDKFISFITGKNPRAGELPSNQQPPPPQPPPTVRPFRRFVEQDYYYPSAAALTTSLLISASPGIGAFLSGQSLTLPQEVALGALGGVVSSSLSGNLHAHSGKQVLGVLFEQAGLGALQGGAGFASEHWLPSQLPAWMRESEFLSGAISLGAISAVGGGINVINRGSFISGFASSAAKTVGLVGAGLVLREHPLVSTRGATALFGTPSATLDSLHYDFENPFPEAASPGYQR